MSESNFNLLQLEIFPFIFSFLSKKLLGLLEINDLF